MVTDKKTVTMDSKTPDEFGVMYHFGLYSELAFDIISDRRSIQNGSEWAYKRLLEKGGYRPISGWKETQEFFKRTYPGKTYKDLATEFKCEHLDFKQWLDLAKDIGATYAVLTAKHHDGYTLYNTQTTDFNSVKTGPRRDLVREFTVACRELGLKPGLYYSWGEFDYPTCTKDYMNKYMIPQVKELMTYDFEFFWGDAHWFAKTKCANDNIANLVLEMKKVKPGVQLNDRLVKSGPYAPSNDNELGLAAYRVFADRHLPAVVPTVQWEHVTSISKYGWGANRNHRVEHFYTGGELYVLRKKVRALNGRFLLSFGPWGNGSLDITEVHSVTVMRTCELLEITHLSAEFIVMISTYL